MKNLKYLIVGILFGIIFVKAEIFSWFRIQEMFHLQSFFMYGIIGTAVIVAMLSIFIIKKFNIKTFSGDDIVFEEKESNKGQIYGGLIFGIGWAITGSCPGALYAQIGAGFLVVGVVYLSVVFGVWCYGYFKNKLPH
ncbi:YeeE/YedE family protein [Flavobacterium sp. F372]|jgi:uncharacterized membrane protein YedE/YeeE|uniref:YeeE/YedE family protein n=1 Tax=Flavobacterium bernardetii TaxID=2813823 RepID=A0ABR7IYU2_9FLAO|nr:YeeE/YedE thiosulfate transporter family protein [Flavobacterium bernardetii]MBC5834958.1 YeeE/YedE family protein [Flavobacterium bernardetii]NHF70489.1 YeeE/YedE family protein [Flavobacterium bernardetii]